jgi:hypothetical protein
VLLLGEQARLLVEVVKLVLLPAEVVKFVHSWRRWFSWLRKAVEVAFYRCKLGNVAAGKW